jgi:hypothetical protein
MMNIAMAIETEEASRGFTLSRMHIRIRSVRGFAAVDTKEGECRFLVPRSAFKVCYSALDAQNEIIQL